MAPEIQTGGKALMRRIDELHLNYLFAGARMLRDMLALEGMVAGPRPVTWCSPIEYDQHGRGLLRGGT